MAGSLHEQLVESLTPGRVVASVVLLLFGSLILDIARKPSYPSSIPRVGYGSGFFASIRNMVGYVMHYRDWVQEGYDKHAKKGRAFVVQAAASRPPDIVLPPSQTAWMLDQPDKILSAHVAHNETLYSEYNFLGKSYADDVWHTVVIHKSLARHLPTLIPGVEEEVKDAMDRVFGTDTEKWTSLNLWKSWLGIVPQITNRMLIGSEVCRNPQFLDRMVHFVDAVVANCFFLGLFPRISHPVIARLFTLPNWWHWRRSTAFSIPVIRKRLEDMARKEAGDPEYATYAPPEDFVTWTIRLAKAEGRTQELDPYVISKRTLPVEFAAIHTTVLTGHSVILDLISSDPAKGFLESLREEASRVLAEEGGHWTKNGLARLYRLDSAIRESMRRSNFATTLVERKVIAKDGLTNPHEGWHVPYGAFITLNQQGVQSDASLYEDPLSYDAFRTSRAREEYEARPADQKDPDEALRLKKLGMVTTSDKHLAFGHGRHACPGRFFVAHELKMIVAYLLLNYDIKHIPERPATQWMGGTIIPAIAASVEVKRRAGTV